QVWEHPSRFDPKRGGLQSWLGVIAHRRAVDWVRREVAHQRIAALVARQADPDRAPPPGPAETVLAADTRAQVMRAVEALPEPQRACVRLAYFEGHTYRQVAAALGIPEGTAKSRVRLGLAALARRLAQAGLTAASDVEDRTGTPSPRPAPRRRSCAAGCWPPGWPAGRRGTRTRRRCRRPSPPTPPRWTSWRRCCAR